MDMTTWHDQRPSHPPVDPELAYLRDRRDEAERAYQRADEARIYAREAGEPLEDLTELLDELEKWQRMYSARWQELNRAPADYRMASSDPAYKELK